MQPHKKFPLSSKKLHLSLVKSSKMRSQTLKPWSKGGKKRLHWGSFWAQRGFYNTLLLLSHGSFTEWFTNCMQDLIFTLIARPDLIFESVIHPAFSALKPSQLTCVRPYYKRTMLYQPANRLTTAWLDQFVRIITWFNQSSWKLM